VAAKLGKSTIEEEHVETEAEASQKSDSWVSKMLDQHEDKLSAVAKAMLTYRPHYLGAGQAKQVSARIPLNLERMMEIVVIHPHCPLKTPSDLIRDAIFIYTKAFAEAYEMRDSELLEMLATQELEDYWQGLREQRQRIRRAALNLRDALTYHVLRDEMLTARVVLRRFYDNALKLQPSDSEQYKTLIRLLPVAQYVAWSMRDIGDGIPWELALPEQYMPQAPVPETDWGGDEGVPPEEQQEEEIRVKERRKVYMRGYRSGSKEGGYLIEG
jgi:hypothetical protein